MGFTVCSLGKEKSINYQIFNRMHKKKYRKAIKILISVVIGALLLAGLYALFGDIILPTLEERIQDMFDFAG